MTMGLPIPLPWQSIAGGILYNMILSLIQFELFLIAIDCFGWAVVL